MNFKEFSQSKGFRGFIIGVGVFIILAFVFQAGMFVGLKKAEFSGRLGENYGRIFGEERGPGMMNGTFGMPFDNIPGGHGAVGEVLKISSSTIVVAEPGNVEKIVTINGETIIRKNRDEIKTNNIKVGDFVSVLGEANNNAEIEARFIRVMPGSVAATTTIKNNK